MLIDAGRAAEADAFFDAALRRNPKRSLSLAGRARAAAASGQRERARALYSELVANFANADAGAPLLDEARMALADGETRPPAWVGLFASTGGLMIAGAITAAIVAGAIVARRSRRRRPATVKKMGPRARAHRPN